jgi:hypothetical protein
MLYLSLASCESKNAGMSLLTCSSETHAIAHTIKHSTMSMALSGSARSPSARVLTHEPRAGALRKSA